MFKPVFAPLLLIASCAEGVNSPIDVITSTEGERQAVLFERSAGATTGFSMQISIIGPGDYLKGAGNTFIADSDHGRAAAARWGGPHASMKWLGPRELEISYDRLARVFKQDEEVRGVTVRYRTVAILSAEAESR